MTSNCVDITATNGLLILAIGDKSRKGYEFRVKDYENLEEIKNAAVSIGGGRARVFQKTEEEDLRVFIYSKWSETKQRRFMNMNSSFVD